MKKVFFVFLAIALCWCSLPAEAAVLTKAAVQLSVKYDKTSAKWYSQFKVKGSFSDTIGKYLKVFTAESGNAGDFMQTVDPALISAAVYTDKGTSDSYVAYFDTFNGALTFGTKEAMTIMQNFASIVGVNSSMSVTSFTYSTDATKAVNNPGVLSWAKECPQSDSQINALRTQLYDMQATLQRITGQIYTDTPGSIPGETALTIYTKTDVVNDYVMSLP